MKKILSLLLIMFLLVPSMLLPVFSAGGKLTKAEATELFELSFYRFMLVQHGDPALDGDDYNSLEMKKIVGYTNMSVGDPEDAPANVPEEYGEVHFMKPEPPSGGLPKYDSLTLDELKAFLGETFAADMIPRIFKRRFGEETEKRDIFYSDPITQKLYAYVDVESFWTLYSITSELCDPDVQVVSFCSDTTTAEMNVILYHGRHGLDYSPTTETVKFEKTAKGWRVSGGSAFDWLLGDAPASWVYERTEFEKLAKKAYDRFMLIQHGEAYAYEFKNGDILSYYENYLYDYVYDSTPTDFGGKPYLSMTTTDFTTKAQIEAFGAEVMTSSLLAKAMTKKDGTEIIKEKSGEMFVYEDFAYNRPYTTLAKYGKLTMLSETRAKMNITIRYNPCSD